MRFCQDLCFWLPLPAENWRMLYGVSSSSGHSLTLHTSDGPNVALAGFTAGKTALYDAISDALIHLKQRSHDNKALIVVSDGGDNTSRHSLPETIALAVKSDAMIYTICLFDLDDPDRN
jgi:hypothetical protein